MIVQCLEAVLAESYTNETLPRAQKATDPNDFVHKIEAQLACLRRLFGSKSGFHAFTLNNIRDSVGSLVMSVLRKNNESIDYATVEMLCSLMQPMHANSELRFEQQNKQILLQSDVFVEHLLQLVVGHVVSIYLFIFSSDF